MTNKEAIEQLKWVKQRICDITYSPESFEAINIAIEKLREEGQTGEWIEENSEVGALGIKYSWFRCNQCGWDNGLVIPKNFCPNCGADMRKGENDNGCG